ncbi:MAG: hypothetical protein KTR25_17885 [Myxococcales bacterium]|nr:hypothetical protein [Myxococcales bacterium]
MTLFLGREMVWIMGLNRMVAGLVLLSVGWGCQTTPPLLSLRPQPDIEREDYPRMLNRWTRKDEVFDGIYSIMYVRSTFHAPEFRRAFIERFPDAYGRGSEEARRITLANPEAENHWEFFLTASTPNQRLNDLADADSVWRVTLRADDGPWVLAKVRLIKSTDNLKVFYPYLSPFASAYRLEFPLTSLEGKPIINGQTRHLRLRISSALGVAELEWQFVPEGRISLPSS